MKIKRFGLFLMVFLGLSITACIPSNIPLSTEQHVTPSQSSLASNVVSATQTPTNQDTLNVERTTKVTSPIVVGETTIPLLNGNTPDNSETPPESNAMINITISVGGSSFSAKLYDNETSRALLEKFPVELNMDELNGREKFHFLPENLPFAYAETPDTIHAGEIMLWSSNCLVLFYNTFPNTVSGYVKLGYVEDVEGFASALGGESSQVTFTISDQN